MLLTVGAYKVNEKADHKSKYLRKKRKRKEKKEKIKKRKLFPAGLEPATLRVVRAQFEPTCEAHVITTTLRKPLIVDGEILNT